MGRDVKVLGRAWGVEVSGVSCRCALGFVYAWVCVVWMGVDEGMAVAAGAYPTPWPPERREARYNCVARYTQRGRVRTFAKAGGPLAMSD